MARQGYDLQLTRYNEKGWRATFYTTGMEHSPTNATGTEWEHAVARDAAGGVGSSEKGRDLMALKITGFSMWLHVLPAQLLIDYTALTPIEGQPAARRAVSEYHAQFTNSFSDLPPELACKLSRIADYAVSALDLPEVDLDGVTARGTATLVYYQLLRLADPTPGLHVVYQSTVSGSASSTADVPISEATKRLIDNILPMCEQLAWEHFRARFGVPDGPTSGKKKVYLSYRKGVADRREFVEAIAHRLGREGFSPWYDDWEILAGDSLRREMADGLESAYGIITIITADYPGVRWAREELENAIVQRVTRGIKVIPVLYEPCEIPVLLEALSCVDCTVHDPERFEHQFLRIIDALNEIELNPYR